MNKKEKKEDKNARDKDKALELINYDNLDEIEEFEEIKEVKEEESKLKKLIKKLYVIFIVLFLLSLLLFNSLFGTHAFQIITGKIISKEISIDYTITLNNSSKIFFGEDNYNILLYLFRENQQTEIKVCLLGEKIENNYYIKGIYVPKTFQKDVYSVTSLPCNSSTIISLHTHPILHCIFSNQDMESYNKYKYINKDMIMALMCDEKRFSFFGY